MADLTEIQASQSVKLAGADPSTGIESFWMQVDSFGTGRAGLFNTAGSAIDMNFGTASAASIRVAALLGNATGAADFNAGATGAQTLRAHANQGAPGTAANGWFARLTDGTNNVAVKAASTAAVAADPSLVVALSPNSPLPAGTAIIGALVANQSINLAQVAGATTVTGGLAGLLGVGGNVASAVADTGNPVKVGGPFNTTQPTVTNGQRVDFQATSRGAQIVATGTDPFNSRVFGVDNVAAQHQLLTDTSGRLIVATGPIGGSNSGFAFGDIFTMATTQVAVRRTAYTEQAANAQRSVVSTSANDTAAGTGARTVRITYYTSAGVGPSTETLTLNGTTPVNTVSTTICFIDKIEVLTVGSTGSNVGVVNLKAATAGGGVTVGSIAATDNQTFWAHHYVGSGKIGYISGFSINSSAINISDSTLFIIKALTIGVANSVEFQISDFHNLFGQNSGTNTRNYGSPIVVTGPARITVYAKPASANQITHRASFDYSES